MRSGKRGDIAPRQEEQNEKNDVENIPWEEQDNYDDEKLKSVKRAGDQSWGVEFLRSLRSRAGLARRGGRRAWFGGAHMMRSGKRASWSPCGPTEELEEDDSENFANEQQFL